MQVINKYTSVLLTLLFLTASTGLHIIEHYCDTCETEGVFLSADQDNHHTDDHSAGTCGADCMGKHHHQSHEQCEVLFFKVTEPFLGQDNLKSFTSDAEQSTLYHSVIPNPEIQVAALHKTVHPNYSSTPRIYVYCQMLI